MKLDFESAIAKYASEHNEQEKKYRRRPPVPTETDLYKTDNEEGDCVQIEETGKGYIFDEGEYRLFYEPEFGVISGDDVLNALKEQTATIEEAMAAFARGKAKARNE